MISPLTRHIVFHRDNFRCVWCGENGVDAQLQIDHMYPRALDGGDHLSNLVTACRACNASKRDRILGHDWFPKIRTSGWYWDFCFEPLLDSEKGP